MDYLSSTMGIRVTYQTWEQEARLPYFIIDKYKTQVAYLENVKALFLYPIADLDQIGAIRKQILRIQKIENIPVVLVLDKITRQRRQYLMEAHIPFVVEDRQIYLPFLGVALQERFDVEVKLTEKLQPSSQVLLLYFIYQNQGWIFTNDAVKVLGFSAMTITRAARQLEMTGMFRMEKEGVQKVLLADLAGQELFEKARPFLVSPVRKIIYIGADEVTSGMLLSGDSALAKKSMLNSPATSCYAIDGKIGKELQGSERLLDANRQIRLEIWKYTPQLLAEDGMVDTLSLALSLMDEVDERVEEALDEMLNTFWRKLDGKHTSA